MDWKSQLNYVEPQFTEHEVNGKKHKFFPVTSKLIFEIKSVAYPISEQISNLCVSERKDIKVIDQTMKVGDGQERRITTEPIPVDLAKYRDELRAKSIRGIMESATNDKAMALLASIIMDSMSEVFPRDPKTGALPVTVEEFLTETKLPTLIQLIYGAFKANKDVLGPLAPQASSLLSSLVGLVTTRTQELASKVEGMKSSN